VSSVRNSLILRLKYSGFDQEFQLNLGPGRGIRASPSNGNGIEHVMLIELDVSVAHGSLQLVDSFEWDISNPDNVPEEFASQLVADHMLMADCQHERLLYQKSQEAITSR
jgi:hypothetical protein